MLLAPRFRGTLALAMLLMVVPGRAASAQAPPAVNSCLACHARLPEARLAKPAVLFSQPDIHRESGFQCVDCHGGDNTSGDKAGAHNAALGFKGAPSGQAQIATCARCHSYAELMRRFSPR